MIFKFCKKCKLETKHREITDKRKIKSHYYSCSVCLQNNSNAHRKRHWFRYLAQKANARKRPNSVKITEEHITNVWSKQNNKCALTNQILEVEDKLWKPSLDRIDSSKGYTPDNIRIVAWILNRSRGDLTDEEFIDMCNKVTNNS